MTSPIIAIIEDDKNLSDMYAFKFSVAGYTIHCAYDGEEGLELIKNVRPDIVLLDLKMPKISGDEMLKKIRATEWGSEIRVIILTNISKDEAPSSLRLLGIERYIVKAHHTPAQVLEIVNEVLGIKQKRVVR